jgi:hypothetical protein
MLPALDERLAEAHGLTMAASALAATLAGEVADDDLRAGLERMRSESDAIRRRCLALERRLGEDRAQAILAHANGVAQRGAGLRAAWFTAGTEPVSALTFLAAAEAAESAAWSALEALAEDVDPSLHRLAASTASIQRRHLGLALAATVALARRQSPAANPPTIAP